MWIALVVAVVLVGLTVAAIFGRVDGSLVDPTSSLSYAPLPDGPLSPDDVQGLRLDTGLRGYRMEQVDEVIDRLTAEITVLRDQIDAATTAAYQPGLDADPSMPPASLFVRPSEWAEFSEPIARPDSQA
jgi:DivIVA domain-containing protein